MLRFPALTLALFFFFATIGQAAKFGDAYLPASQLREELLLSDHPRPEGPDSVGHSQKLFTETELRTKRASMREAVTAAYRFLEQRSQDTWRALTAKEKPVRYDLVVVGLGPNGVAAYSRIVDSFYQRHGRAPHALIVGKEIGGSFHRGTEFVLNTPYLAESNFAGNGSQSVVWGFSPHRTGFALDSLEIDLSVAIFDDLLNPRFRPEAEYASPSLSNTVNVKTSAGSLVRENHELALRLARQAGALYHVSQSRAEDILPTGPFAGEPMILQPVLRSNRGQDILFPKNDALADSVALELARLNAVILSGVDVDANVALGKLGSKLLTLRRGNQELKVGAAYVMSFPGPGPEKNPFPAGSAGAQIVEEELAKKSDGLVQTTDTVQRRLRDPATRAKLARELEGKSVFFMGNGDSSLVTMEALLRLRPNAGGAPRFDGEMPKAVAQSLRRSFRISRLSVPLIDELLGNGARLGRDGKASVSRSPLQGDRYRSVLSWMKSFAHPSQLVDEYVSDVARSPDGGLIVITESGERFPAGLVVLGAGKAEATGILSGGTTGFRAVRGKVQDVFSSLSGPAMVRAEKTLAELTAEKTAAAPEITLGLQDAGKGIFVGGFVPAMLKQVKADAEAGAIPSTGSRAAITVANPAGLPSHLPRARELGAHVFRAIFNEQGRARPLVSEDPR